MAIIKTKARQDTGVARVSEGGDVYVRSTRDGSLFMADWKQAMIMEGRGFMINVGALTTPITGGGTGNTKPDANSPDISILVPSGTSFLPIRVEVEVSLPVIAATGNEVDILLGVDQDASHIADATAAGAAEVAYNMNTLHTRTSNCTTRSKNSTAYTDTLTMDIEITHVTKSAKVHTSVGTVWQNMTLLYEPITPYIINGPAAFLGFWGGTAATSGFAIVQWIEIPSSML